ncbi:uncharacterized protein [Onthophagus taurus]|uniref:uncharacterized protein n=1 Tax=Onthophagus taurus TaxID=166361 RepID=UPI000C20E5E7|nr:uncharacterized protein LOC111427501 [Onthophagus taurus]
MSFKCPKMEELARNLAAHNVIDGIANELKQDYPCACEFILPPPQHHHQHHHHHENKCHCEGCECPCAAPKHQPKVEEPPPVMVCYKVPKEKKPHGKTGKGGEKGDKKSHNEGEEVVHRVTQSKSRELRGGIMYIGCDCEKRNGLQDDCQRTGCHGSPPCLTKPPTCGPSEFAGAKHLEKIWGPRALLRKKAKEATLNSGAEGGAKENGGQHGHHGHHGHHHGQHGDDEVDYEYQCFPACIKAVEPEAKCCPCS